MGEVTLQKGFTYSRGIVIFDVFLDVTASQEMDDIQVTN